MTPLTLVLFVLGVVALVGGAELLVRGASRLAGAVGISPLVIGLTVVAYGTSAPELAVSVIAAHAGQPEIALGNVVGSNICNVLLILGMSALVAPLVVAQQLVRFDVPLMIGVSVLALLMGIDGTVSRLDGLVLFAGAVAYTVFSIRQSRKESREVAEEYEKEYGDKPGRTWVHLLLVAVGIGLLVLGSKWLVDGAIAIATALGVSELVIGLTVIAVGTSLPELATSVVASVRGERDIAVGNVVGSNLFNILSVLGLGSVFAPAGIPVPRAALLFDLPVMIAVAVACLPIFFTGFTIARWEGLLFVGYYAAYIVYLVLDATGHTALPSYELVMTAFALPLTVVTLGVIAVRGLRQPRPAPPASPSRAPPEDAKAGPVDPR